MNPAATVGVVGLGAMGGPVARHLLSSGRTVLGVDPDTARQAAFIDRGGEVVATPSALVGRASVVLTLLPSPGALADVARALADGAARAPADLVVAEMSTLGLDAKLAARDVLEPVGIGLLDCPLSGTAVQAERGDLVVYASGPDDALDRCDEVFGAMSRRVIRVGAFGTGTKTKLVANLLVAVHIVAAAEALLLAERAGLDGETTLAALTAGAGTSRMLEVRGPMMVEHAFDEPSMTLALFAKDLALIDEFARSVGAPTPLLSAADALYAAARAAGERRDTAAVFDALAESRP